MKPLPEHYNHVEAEKRWQEYWERERIFAWVESETREQNFVIDTPPPTVSGVLHMGHIFSYTQADFVARYQRMKGKNVFYPMGYDDNGLPTERLVEKVKKVRATDMSREDFIKLCEEVTAEARIEFHRLFESVALSVDWEQEYHTISEESRKISQLSFLDLYHKNHAYRKLQPMLWDPVDQTAIAQAEIVDKEMASFANYIPFGMVNEGTKAADIKWGRIEKVEIMTTRPELLAACVALMCHPDDAEKYRGKQAVTPLFGVVVPIIADEKVDKEKGTGLVMCCTFGDETDIHWWQKHKLETRIVLNKYGKLDLSGDWLKADETRAYCSTLEHKLKELNNVKVSNPDPKHPGARERTIEILKSEGLMLRQEPITHAVKCAERSGAALEILPTHQWFVKVLEHKEALKKKANECVWNPDFMRIRIEQWIDGLNWDWCISRQRFFGVPFPVWYSKRAGEEGRIILADKDQLPVNPLKDLPKGYSRDEVIAEADVMDTWATSSISPQLSSKAINKDYALDVNRHAKLFPADVRPQAHEIIRTWAFYTIVKAYLHEDTIPWKNLMISGWCLAPDKTKMSKSKGNVITPVELIEEKGADPVRFWSSTSRLGTDTAFSEDVLKIGKKLVTKLWNASKFASIQLENLACAPVSASDDVAKVTICEVLDLWILTRLKRAIEKADNEFSSYEYSAARAAAEDFFWNDFCDNYLELIKARAYDEQNPKGRVSAAHTIYHCLNGILKLFAPFVPHITDELYSHIFDKEFAQKKSIHARGNWPDAKCVPEDEHAEKAGQAAVSVLALVRKIKAEKGVSIKWPLTKVTIQATAEQQLQLQAVLADLKAAGNISAIAFGPASAVRDESGSIAIDAKFASESDAA